MIEAYKQILKQGLSVRGAEDLTRKMKAQYQKSPKPARDIVTSEEMDKIQKEMSDSLQKVLPAKVKLRRSRIETKIMIVLKGNIEETDGLLKKLHQAITAI